MREILFRGKRMDNGELVFGDLIREPWGYCIQVVTGSGNGYSRKKYAITEETVGQYTGLKDKNGKRIFEWDVIKRFWLGAEIIYCVRYDGEYAHFIGNSMNKSGFTTFDNDGEMFEVIGNIHDNPELWKGGDEG